MAVRSVSAAVLSMLMLAPSAPNAKAESPGGMLEMSLAIRIAEARTGQPGCEAVYRDFRDGEGRTLADRLVEKGETARENFHALTFRFEEDAPTCRRGDVLAYASIGGRDIRICTHAFRAALRRDAHEVVAILIHEHLHLLGLGENPPASREITEQVRKRC